MKLTPREKEVLKLTMQGLSARKAGVLLGISGKTVEFHIANIKQKLGVYSKVQLIQLA